MSSSSRNQSLTTAKTVISTVGSFAATTMLIRAIIKDFLPYELNDALLSSVRNFLTRLLTRNITLVIQQYDGLVKNELYHSVLVYLHPKLNPNTRRLKITKPETESRFTLSMFSGEEFVDVFEGQKFKWISVCEKTEVKDSKNTKEIETRSFELTFHKKNEQLVLNSYLPHVTEKAQAMEQENRTVRIFTLDDFIRSFEIGSIWKSVTLDHPATFDTLAMDLDVKEMVKSDLDRFMARKEYYRKVGKAWKRGYLLYGPPGTGKSSLIAAIANYLKFDVYDLELTALKHNAELRRLLLGTANRSILVMEDIDCTIDALDNLGSRSIGTGIAAYGNELDPKKSKNKVTLSGVLNFVDGLWSSCGDERIIIFTTNNVEKLDPALLRPGRMDVHINMSYCTPCGFKLLASNYLEIEEHAVFEEIEGLIPTAKVTPAEVAEQLLKNDNPDVSLQGLVDFLHKKIKENEEAEAAAAAENLGSEEAAQKEIERLMPLANLTDAEIVEQSFKYDPDVSMRRIVGYMRKKIIDDKEAEVAAKKLKTEAAADGAAAAAEKLEAEEDAT